jgi:hypothetical protein
MPASWHAGISWRDNPNGSTSFIGDGPFGDGGCNNCYFGEIALLSVPSVSGVLEPSTWAMMLLGFAGVGFMAYPSPASTGIEFDTNGIEAVARRCFA